MICKYPGTSTESQSHNEESLLLTTGGFADYSYLSSVEVYPSTSGCSPPALPQNRRDHTTFLTSEPNPVIATCGGRHTTSCLVLDKSNQRWDETRMGNLTMPRKSSAVAISCVDYHPNVIVLVPKNVDSGSPSNILRIC